MRSLIEKIIVSPSSAGGVEVALIGEIGTIVRLALGPERKKAAPGGTAVGGMFERSVKVVAGTGNHRELTIRCSV